MATLVRRAAPLMASTDGDAPRPAVLYLHGFVDYFFHPHVAEAFEARGYRFYALDLRGYGRSIERGVQEGGPNHVSELAVYTQDLDAAVAAIRAEGHRRIVVNAHSTGGLIGPLWAAERPGTVEAMVLNSPWLELNGNWFLRGPATALVDLVGRIRPTLKVSGMWPHYGEALHVDTGGEWDYALAWKPHLGFPVTAGWFRSVRRAHRRLKRGLGVGCPILVATSTKRGDNRHWHPEVITSDSVLNPAHMWAYAHCLGPDVEVRTFPGGAHDLALSPEPARSAYLDAALTWLDAVTAGHVPEEA
jgi:alpha-beta hydrolase superfamily lysophospholipase